MDEGGLVGAVVERLVDVPGLEPFVGAGVGGGEIGAAGDGDGAEPGDVGGVAVGAVLGEGVLRRRGGFAGDLLEGVGEVFVEGGGVVVVELGEVGSGGECVGVGGNGVGDVGAEG